MNAWFTEPLNKGLYISMTYDDMTIASLRNSYLHREGVGTRNQT